MYTFSPCYTITTPKAPVQRDKNKYYVESKAARIYVREYKEWGFGELPWRHPSEISMHYTYFHPMSPRNTKEPERSANFFFSAFLLSILSASKWDPALSAYLCFTVFFLKWNVFFCVCVCIVCYSIMYLKGFVLCSFFLCSIRSPLWKMERNCWESFWLCCCWCDKILPLFDS